MGPAATAKHELRTRLLAARRRRDPADVVQAGRALAAHAAAEAALAGHGRVAAYLAMRHEPPTNDLLTLLRGRGTEVIVPIARPDRTLTWALHDTDAETSTSPLGIDEPVAGHLTGDPLATVGLVLVPALAVDHRGRRLGRGAGYYDRALAALGAPGAARSTPLVCAVVFSDELLPEVPAEPHDVAVDLVLTEAGLFRPER